MANKAQPFTHHHLVRAFRAAAAAGVPNPSVQVQLANGTTIVIGGADGKPDKAATATLKPVKAQPTSRHSRRSIA